MITASKVEALKRLGFDASLHISISTFISLQLPSFTIHHKAVKDGDVIKFNLFFEKKNNECSCLYYDAILRKEIIIPDIIVDGISLKELDEQMNSIDWNNLFDREQSISSIINDLIKLDASKEGREFAEPLKVKCWCDTPLESIMNISPVKSKYEIAQRFYFFEDGRGISIEEAYRFLNNKWMERQMRKKPVSTSFSEIKDKSKSKKRNKEIKK